MAALREDDVHDFDIKPARGSGGAWFVAVLAMAAAGGAGYLGWTEHEKRAGDSRELAVASAKLVAAEAQQKDLAAKLEAAETERAQLASAKDELSKNVQLKDEELAKLKATQEQLAEKLKAELKSGEVSLSEDGGRLRVGLVDKVLFNSGEATITKRGETVLQKVGSILATVNDRQIQVSGHTDQMPIGEKRSAQFPTNWELSTARATNVVRFLQDKAKVPGERLLASGYGEYHPVASNRSSTGRAKNRRIEILLTPIITAKTIAKSKIAAKSPAKSK
jgi:chemotaxis protein MotB